MKIKVNVFNSSVQLPKRAHYNDAGADVYCPTNIAIKPGETVAINLGFGVEIPDGYFGLIYIRSGMAKRGLEMPMPPIDSGYRGNIHAIIRNESKEIVVIEKGDRIGQLVIQPVVLAEYVTDLGEERGTGAFGSTGK